MNYAASAARAASMLAKYGQTVTLRQIAEGTYDTSSSAVTAPAPVDVSRAAAVFDFKEGERNAPGSLIQTGDKRAYMEAGIVPTQRDRMIVQGTLWKIVSVFEINPAGTPVLYDLHLRM